MSSRLPALLLALGVLTLAAFAAQERSGSSAGAAGSAGTSVAFTYGELPTAIDLPTSLAFGPDGRLYVTSYHEIHALTLAPDGRSVVDVETIATDLSGVIGLAFDPVSPETFYVSRQDPSATPGFLGTVTRFTGPDWQHDDIITGLPTSAPQTNHLTNSLAFDAQGKLVIAQGSGSDSGVTDSVFSAPYWPETPLSGALLVADIHAPDFNGQITYSPAGSPMDTNVNKLSGDVSVFAAGLRNPYDFVLHSNGHIYATDNGAMGFATSLTCQQTGGAASTSDELNLIEQGKYYGFPNRNRGRFDPRQCTYHSPAQGNGPDYTAPIAILPSHCSCDGIAEYTSDAFGGTMRGDLVVAQWSFGRVSRIQLSTDGRSIINSVPLSGAFNEPLDVAVAADGMIYVADFGDGIVSYLAPDISPTPTPTRTPVGFTPGPSATPQPTSTATPTLTPRGTVVGDVNCDGAITAVDAALVLQFSSGLFLPLPCTGNADANADGTVNAIDAALILQFAAGLIGHLPP